MKPVIIKAEKVIEALFNDKEVLHIYFNPKNGSPLIKRLSQVTIANVREIVEEAGNTSFFVQLSDEEEAVEETTENTETTTEEQEDKENV